MPVKVDGRVPGCINMTWIRRVTSQADAVRDYLHDIKAVADELARELAKAPRPGNRQWQAQPGVTGA